MLRFKGQPASTPPAPAAGDEWARTVWEVHRRWVAAVLLAHKPREVELDDLLQEVAMKLFRAGGKLNDPAALKPWLRSVALNAARTAGRRRKVRRRVMPGIELDLDLTPATPDRASDDSGAAEEGRRLLELVQRLEPEYREPLLLRAVRGLSYKHIAEVLGVPVTTIETRLVRARRMLRDLARNSETTSSSERNS